MDKDGYSGNDYFVSLATGTKGRMVPRDELLATLSKQLDDMFNSVERDYVNKCEEKDK
jgi:hypothetical protein